MSKWPRDNQDALIAFYGNPGSDQVAAQLVKVTPPFKMSYEGTPVAALVFHKKASDALLSALNKVWDFYGRDQKKIDALGISKTAGTYNKRLIRGSATKWSNHAYGAAIDLNAEENGFNVEGNIPLPVIAAFKSEGFRWGGDYHGRTDPMHFEACDSGEPERSFEDWLTVLGVTKGGVGPAATPISVQGPTPVPIYPIPSNRQKGIIATVFGGAGDVNKSAYTGRILDDRALYVALPVRFSGQRPQVQVINPLNGKSAVAAIEDIGPWNDVPGDKYWETGRRPQAESGTDQRGRHTNGAGIDLSPALARVIGIDGKGKVDWEFVGATIPTPVAPPPRPAPQPSSIPPAKPIGLWAAILALFGRKP